MKSVQNNLQPQISTCLPYDSLKKHKARLAFQLIVYAIYQTHLIIAIRLLLYVQKVNGITRVGIKLLILG